MLSVSNVRVRFPSSGKPALQCPEVTVAPGEVVALGGPSGCGKSTLGLAILGLLPADAELTGRITFGDRELDARSVEALRGRHIAWIPQDVGASLSPFHTVARQVAEVAEVHEGISRKVAQERAGVLLARLGIEDATRRMHEHPHRWSGGMLQRALIAMALMTTPELVIADEPTSALDPTSRQAVVDLFRERAAAGVGFLVITHDSALIAALDARVVYGVAPLSPAAG